MTAELIERLEKATGPDRELDRDLWFAADQPLLDFGPSPPAYTASIDAALTLVPDGADIAIYFASRTKHSITDKWRDWHAEIDTANRVYTGRSDSGATAVSIAALKARAAVLAK